MSVLAAVPRETPSRGELTLAKQQLELELLRAQLVQLARTNKPTSPIAHATNLIKVLGSIVLGIGGISAAITGYQLNELKNERLMLSMEKEQQKLEGIKVDVARQRDALKATSDATRAYQAASEAVTQSALQISARQTSAAPLNPQQKDLQKQSDTQNIEFQKVKNEIQKLSQQQQALSNALQTMEDLSKSNIRFIRAG